MSGYVRFNTQRLAAELREIAKGNPVALIAIDLAVESVALEQGLMDERFTGGPFDEASMVGNRALLSFQDAMHSQSLELGRLRDGIQALADEATEEAAQEGVPSFAAVVDVWPLRALLNPTPEGQETKP